MHITETTLPENALVNECLRKVDYQDAFLVNFKDASFEDIDMFAEVYFLSQPAWLRAVSMNRFSKQSIEEDIQTSAFNIDTQIGSWKIYDRGEKEIVFGESMGFMEYRFSMIFVDFGQIVVSTVVQLNTSSGRYYFALVKLMHKAFVKRSLQNIGDR